MDFFKGFLRGMALLPGVIQDTETLFGGHAGAQTGQQQTGQQKKAAAIAIVGATISVADAISTQKIADPERFTAGLSEIVDGIVSCLNASVWAKR